MPINKWRPNHKCYYVVSSIHGNYDSLEIIKTRLFPLRTHKNQEDKIIFMGNYIGQHELSFYVVESLLNIDNAVFIKGKNECDFLNALTNQESYNQWLQSGGLSVATNYLKAQNYNESPIHLPLSRFKSFIPEAHLNFFKNCKSYYKDGNYLFLHGGFNYLLPFVEADNENYCKDTSLLFEALKTKSLNLKDDLFVITGINNKNEPILLDNFLNLSSKDINEIYVFDLHSLECTRIKDGKENLYKYPISYYQ